MTISDGYYKCRATGEFEEDDLGYSGASGETAGVAVECEIFDNDSASLGKMKTYLYVTANSADLAAKRLRALGLVGNDISSDFAGLGSVLADCVVKTEVYDGKARQKLEIKTGGGAAFKAPMNPVQRRKFAATFSRYLEAVPVVEGASIQGAPVAKKSGPDDIPF